MRWIKYRNVSQIVIVDDRPRERKFFGRNGEWSLKFEESAVGMVDDQVAGHFADEEKFVFAYAGCIGGYKFCKQMYYFISQSFQWVSIKIESEKKKAFSRIDSCTGPQIPGLTSDRPNMLRTFFHLACQIQRRRKHKKHIRPSDFHFCVEPSQIDLRCGDRLLPYCRQALRQFDYL